MQRLRSKGSSSPKLRNTAAFLLPAPFSPHPRIFLNPHNFLGLLSLMGSQDHAPTQDRQGDGRQRLRQKRLTERRRNDTGFGNTSLRRWQKGNKNLPSPYYVPGSVLGARNTVTK